MNERQHRRRILNRLCVRHNTPLAASNTFDGYVCSLGCKHPETVRQARIRRYEEERRPPLRVPPDPLKQILADLREIAQAIRTRRA